MILDKDFIMLFASNRTPTSPIQLNQNEEDQPIDFDLQNNTVSSFMYYCERKAVNHYVFIGEESFFQQLTLLPENTQILFYIHGFNDTGEARIFPHADLLQALINHNAQEQLVHVIPLIWPCYDDSIFMLADDYYDDQKAADQSGAAFAEFFKKIQQWLPQSNHLNSNLPRKIQLFTHSMGARVLKNALKEIWDRENAISSFFINAFIAAPDLVNNELEVGEDGELIGEVADNIVIYYAADDLALGASRLANLRYRILARRLGRSGIKNMANVADNIYQVNCNNFNHQFEPAIGHVYFLTDPWNRTSPIIAHVTQAIKTGIVVPNQRQHILLKPQNSDEISR